MEIQLPLFEPNGNVVGRSQRVKSPSQPRTATPISADRNPWSVPSEIIKQAIATLGNIDVDPCAIEGLESTVPARIRYYPQDNALLRPWNGRVWLNPPYGRSINRWINKLCDEYEQGGVFSALLLVPARTESDWWHRISLYPFCAIRGRVKYIRLDGKKNNFTYGSMVFYLGPQLARFSAAFADIGAIYTSYNASYGQ